ncbi:MAG: hypothetical protein JNJ71_10045 [Rubrivivax sp.]|nr:hypothetical protein [Rubrivivax sp.]
MNTFFRHRPRTGSPARTAHGRPGTPLTAALRTAVQCLLALLATGLLLAGCGGGVGSGGTGSYASGAISGFGSIIVNEVRFDDSAASVLDDDDATRSNSELKLGMTVEVEAGSIASDSSGRRASATRIRFGSELLGPVATVDTAGSRFTVLGQTVQVSAETVFDERLASGIDSLRAGNGVEVYALFDAASGVYRATRIEPRSPLLQWRVRGIVTALDNSARTLRIGNAVFAWGSAGSVPADLAVGRTVRLPLATTLDASGRYVVSSFATALRPPPDRPEAELNGLITGFSSAAAFSVNGLPVDASGASFPDGTAGLRLGTRVQVKGRAEAGSLIATSVSIETEAQTQERGFDLRGALTAVDSSARTITLRGETISTARPDLRLDGGGLADLSVGRQVEVKAQLNPSRTRLEAVRIVFK